MEDKEKYCKGCYDEFYNNRGENNKCWCLENAKPVQKKLYTKGLNSTNKDTKLFKVNDCYIQQTKLGILPY